MSAIPNPAFMHGTDPAAAKRFALDSDLSQYGAMGFTGSLGVNLSAPLTRGGFPGEIFVDVPMPTGYWKPAPAPQMLGMAGDVGGGGGLIPAPSTAGISTPVLAAIAGLAAFYLVKK
jgi:hypothetical protein